MRRLLQALAALLAIALLAFLSWRALPESARPEMHEDPLTTAARSTPNWALALPDDASARAVRTHASAVFAAEPTALLEALEAVALAEPRTELASGAGDPLFRTYVQRSALFRFPDYVSVKALDLGGGRAALALYSRSVYGYSDMGVNGARLTRWLAALEATIPLAQNRVARVSEL